MVWVCLMGLVMPQTVLCQAELTDLWSLVCRKNMIVPVSVECCRQVLVCSVERPHGMEEWLWEGDFLLGEGGVVRDRLNIRQQQTTRVSCESKCSQTDVWGALCGNDCGRWTCKTFLYARTSCMYVVPEETNACAGANGCSMSASVGM